MAEATKGLGLFFLFIQLPQPNEQLYQTGILKIVKKSKAIGRFYSPKLIVRRDDQDRTARRVGGARASGEALPCSLFAKVSRQGHFFGFAFFTANFLAPVKQSKKVELGITSLV